MRSPTLCRPNAAAVGRRGAATWGSVDPIWISLVGRLFGLESLDSRDWKSLDFLGFSRPNRDLSMGCAGFPREIFSLGFSLASRERRQRSVGSTPCRRAGSDMRSSVTRFPLFRNQLSRSTVAFASIRKQVGRVPPFDAGLVPHAARKAVDGGRDSPTVPVSEGNRRTSGCRSPQDPRARLERSRWNSSANLRQAYRCKSYTPEYFALCRNLGRSAFS